MLSTSPLLDVKTFGLPFWGFSCYPSRPYWTSKSLGHLSLVVTAQKVIKHDRNKRGVKVCEPDPRHDAIRKLEEFSVWRI
jgi:hypothetical protein